MRGWREAPGEGDVGYASDPLRTSLTAVPELARVIERAMALVVAGNWAAIEAWTGRRRLCRRDFEDAVQRDGLAFCDPPGDWRDRVYVVLTNDPSGCVYAVDLPLWETGKGMSDYTLELTITAPGTAGERVEVDNFHVM